MRPLGRLSTILMLVFSIPASAQEKKKEKPPALDMSKAVACKHIEGYEDFTELPDAALTSEDKLQVYYRPLNYKVEAVEKPKPGARYHAKFSQDFRIRKKGEKTVLSKKEKVVEYDPTFNEKNPNIYMVNSVGLKGIPPGDYELEMILHDELAEGSTATQILSFTIIATPKVDPASKSEEPAEPDGPTGSKSKKASKKSSKKSGSGGSLGG